MDIVIRQATRADAAVLERLARELNIHQRDPTEFFTLEKVLTDGFGAEPQFIALIAGLAGASVGYALLVPAYETGWAARGSHLNDLHVTGSCPLAWRRSGAPWQRRLPKPNAGARRTYGGP